MPSSRTYRLSLPRARRKGTWKRRSVNRRRKKNNLTSVIFSWIPSTGSHFLDSSFSTFGNQSGIQPLTLFLTIFSQVINYYILLAWEKIWMEDRSSAACLSKDKLNGGGGRETRPVHTFAFIWKLSLILAKV